MWCWRKVKAAFWACKRAALGGQSLPFCKLKRLLPARKKAAFVNRKDCRYISSAYHCKRHMVHFILRKQDWPYMLRVGLRMMKLTASHLCSRQSHRRLAGRGSGSPGQPVSERSPAIGMGLHRQLFQSRFPAYVHPRSFRFAEMTGGCRMVMSWIPSFAIRQDVLLPLKRSQTRGESKVLHLLWLCYLSTLPVIVSKLSATVVPLFHT